MIGIGQVNSQNDLNFVAYNSETKMTIKVIVQFCILDRPKFQSKSHIFQLGLFSLIFHQQGVVVPTKNIPIILYKSIWLFRQLEH